MIEEYVILENYSIEHRISYKKILKMYEKWKKRLEIANIKYNVFDFILAINDSNFGKKVAWLSIDFVNYNYPNLCDEDKFMLHTSIKSYLDKRGSMYDPINVSKKLSITLEEAIDIVSERKKKTAGTLENFIARHGDKVGTEKYGEFKNKSKPSIENYKIRYGNDWENKWKIYLNTRDSSSKKYWTDKLGIDRGTEKYEKLKVEFSKSSNVFYYIEKYGEEYGKIAYKNICLKRGKTKSEMILLHGEDVVNIISMKKSVIFNELIKIYDYETAKSKYENYKINGILPVISKKQNKIISHSKNCVSKKSNQLFTELEIELGRKLKYGTKRNELKLFDQYKNKVYYYDCYDVESNTIIEFNGSIYHPPENISDQDKIKWTNPWGLTWEFLYDRDVQKNNFAIDSGYKLIVVWDYEVSGVNRLHRKILELKEILSENKKHKKS